MEIGDRLMARRHRAMRERLRRNLMLLADDEGDADVDALDPPVPIPLLAVARRIDAAALDMMDQGAANEHDALAQALLIHDGDEAQQGRHAAPLSSLVFDMVRSEHTCTSVLSGWGSDNSCERIVAACNEDQDLAFFALSSTGRKPLHEACLRNACIHVIRALLRANPLCAVELDFARNTPLHLLFVDFSYRAVNAQEIDQIAQDLLAVDTGARSIASASNIDGNKPLHIACTAPDSMILATTLKRLIEASPEAAASKNFRNQTPLSAYCKQRHATPEFARILLDAHPEAAHGLDIGGWTPLHYAAHNGNTALVQFLVNQAPETAVVRTSPDGRTALHLLCMQNPRNEQIPAIEALVAAAPLLEVRDTRLNKTPLHLVCKHPRISLDVVQLLSNHQVAATMDTDGYTPLHYACETGASLEIVQHLLENYVHAASVATRKQDTPLHIACGANTSVGTVRLLMQANPGALITTNDYGFTPLHCVCRAYQPRMGIVQALLEANPRTVTMRTNGGETPVHLACSSGAFVGVLQLLTDAQSSVSDCKTTAKDLLGLGKMTNKIGNTPLHEACFRSTAAFEHIETLAKSNPDWIVARNNAGHTPLQILCKGGRLDERIVTTFASIGGPEVFSVIDTGGHTPLHSASREGTSIDAIQSLIRSYPDALYLKTTYGDTPLHLACLRGASVEVVQFLADASSDGHHSPLMEPNTAGQSPITIVMEQYQILCRAGCCIKSSRPELVRTFDVLAALVKIVYYGTSYEESQARPASLVRACVAIHRQNIRLDPAFIRRAIYLHPQEVRMRDEDGNFPIHIESSLPVEKMVLLDASVTGCCSGSCHKRAGILDMLLESYPEACRFRNKADAFPLGLMILNGRPWNRPFAIAVSEFPPALHWHQGGIDERLLSRTIARVSRECGMDALFNFINSRPEAFRKR